MKPNLLVTIQALDLDDPLHGFFHRWVESAAPRCGRIIVLALRVGRYHLPSNVEVIALRPKGSSSKWEATKTLFTTSWKRRKDYDAVFVRGDAIYVLLAGLIWRFLGKPIAFWYAHWKVNPQVIPASWIANWVVTSVPEACASPFVQPISIGQAIDATRFTLPAVWPPPRPFAGTVFGRAERIKHVDGCILAWFESGCAPEHPLTLNGPRPDIAYAEELSALMQTTSNVQWGSASIPYDEVPRAMQSYDVMLNGYPASLDKSIVEGAMSGQVVVAATNGFARCLPEDLQWLHAPTQETMTAALKKILTMDQAELTRVRERVRQAAVDNHSVDAQITKLFALFD